ncbi:MAG: DUF6612 family protein [Peptostreptococcales bacterium]
MKKFLLLLFSAILLFSMIGCSNEKEALNLLLDATEKSANWENYDAEIESHMKIVDPVQGEMDINTFGTGTIFMEPMKFYMNMDVHLSNMEEVQHIEQYMVQETDNIVLYQNVQGQWYKMNINIDGLGDIMQTDPSEDIQLMMEYTKTAKIVGEEEIKGSKARILDLAISMKMYEEIVAKNEALGSMIPMTSTEDLGKMLSELDDLNYRMWIDKDSGEIVKYSMDLGKMMERLMTKLEIEEMTDEEKEMFKNMEMTITITISNHNTAENFELPEEALNAIDMGDSLE